jgi:predicted transcriptional regulator
MTKPKIDQQKLKALRNQLEHGDLQRIAKHLGISRSTVAKVFTGEIRNIQVIEQALSMVKHRQKVLKCLNSEQ